MAKEAPSLANIRSTSPLIAPNPKLTMKSCESFSSAQPGASFALGTNSLESYLKHVSELVATYPSSWHRNNIDERIRLLTTALTKPPCHHAEESDEHRVGQADVPGMVRCKKMVNNEQRACIIVIKPLDTSFECTVHPQELGFHQDAHDMLTLSESIVYLNLHLRSHASPEHLEETEHHFSSDHKEAAWVMLARAFQDRYEHTDDLKDLELQIACAAYVLPLCTTMHGDALLVIASALVTRHRRHHSGQDIKAAVTILRWIDQTPGIVTSDPAMLFYELGLALQKLFEKFGDMENLERSVLILQNAVDLAPEYHPWRCRMMHILSSGHFLLHAIYGRNEDNEKHERFMNEAMRLCSPGNIYRASALLGMANLRSTFFDQSGEISQLEEANALRRQAIDTCSSRTHSLCCRILGALCFSLSDLYEARGRMEDLDEAITVGYEALELDPLSEGVLTNLAGALLLRYRALGSIQDFEDCMQLHRRTLIICPPGHPRRDTAANNLGNMLALRSDHTSFDLGDLNEGIVLLREVVSLRPWGHPDWSGSQFNLAEALKMRYKVTLHLNDMNEAIDIHKSWAMNPPENIAEEPLRRAKLLYCSNAAELYRLRYERTGNLEDLKSAIKLGEELSTVYDVNHFDPDEHLQLMELASAYRLQAEYTRSSDDASYAMKLLSKALEHAPTGQRARAIALIGLSRLYLLDVLPEQSADRAIELYCSGIVDNNCTAHLRLTEGVQVLRILEKRAYDGLLESSTNIQLLHAYRLTMQLFPQIAYFGLGVQARFDILSNAPNLATSGSVHALLLSQPEAAIEIMEEGRAVFWAQYLRLRSSFNDLPTELSQELTYISRALESGAVSTELSGRGEYSDEDVALYEEKLAKRHRLSERFEMLVEQARSLPGFERFMRGSTFSALSLASEGKPIVVFFANSYFCGAVIIKDPHSGAQQLIFDRKLNAERLKQFHRSMQISRQATRNTLVTRVMKQSIAPQKTPRDVLSDLWTCTMSAVVKLLGYQKASGRHRPRIVLCATGHFSHVPLHAAGTQHEGCWDYCVPSYTPTLGVLLSARNSVVRVRRERAHTILAAVPRPFKWTPLSETVTEIKLLKDIIPAEIVESIPLEPSIIEGPDGSALCDDVLGSLPRASILHLACHGYHSPTNPLDSGFVMADRILTVAKLMALNLPQAFLAFLSACETARSPETQPDQAVHLAATMLFSGFKSVVATMWSMGDIDGPVIAKQVYTELFEGDAEYLDPDSIPYALDAAVAKLRNQRLHPNRWAPYVHFGI